MSELKFHINTAQELLDAFVSHIRKQGAPSFRIVDDEDNGEHVSCMYRGPNGMSCGFGGLIKDEFYGEYLENLSVTHHQVMLALEESGVNPDSMVDLEAEAMQSIHDEAARKAETGLDFMDTFESGVNSFCHRFNLDIPKRAEVTASI